MPDIKKSLILASLLFLPLKSFSQIGCIDEDYSKIEKTTVKRSKSTLTVRLRISGIDTIDTSYKLVRDTLQVRIYGSYITQDYIQLTPEVSLLEYSGFTQLNVVGGLRVLFYKVEGNTLVLSIKVKPIS